MPQCGGIIGVPGAARPDRGADRGPVLPRRFPVGVVALIPADRPRAEAEGTEQALAHRLLGVRTHVFIGGWGKEGHFGTLHYSAHHAAQAVAALVQDRIESLAIRRLYTEQQEG